MRIERDVESPSGQDRVWLAVDVLPDTSRDTRTSFWKLRLAPSSNPLMWPGRRRLLRRSGDHEESIERKLVTIALVVSAPPDNRLSRRAQLETDLKVSRRAPRQGPHHPPQLQPDGQSPSSGPFHASNQQEDEEKRCRTLDRSAGSESSQGLLARAARQAAPQQGAATARGPDVLGKPRSFRPSRGGAGRSPIRPRGH